MKGGVRKAGAARLVRSHHKTIAERDAEYMRIRRTEGVHSENIMRKKYGDPLADIAESDFVHNMSLEEPSEVAQSIVGSSYQANMANATRRRVVASLKTSVPWSGYLRDQLIKKAIITRVKGMKYEIFQHADTKHLIEEFLHTYAALRI